MSKPAVQIVAFSGPRSESGNCSSTAVRVSPVADAGSGRSMIRPALKAMRSEEHTSELQSLMRISYAVFCLKKKTQMDKTQTQILNCESELTSKNHVTDTMSVTRR